MKSDANRVNDFFRWRDPVSGKKSGDLVELFRCHVLTLHAPDTPSNKKVVFLLLSYRGELSGEDAA